MSMCKCVDMNFEWPTEEVLRDTFNPKPLQLRLAPVQGKLLWKLYWYNINTVELFQGLYQHNVPNSILQTSHVSDWTVQLVLKYISSHH